MKIDELKVIVSAETSGYQEGMRKATEATNTFAASTKGANDIAAENASKAAKKIRDEYVKQLDKLILDTEAKFKQIKQIQNEYGNTVAKAVNNQEGWGMDWYFKGDDASEYIKTLKEFKDAVQGGAVEVDSSSIEEIPAAISEATVSIKSMQDSMNEVYQKMRKLDALSGFIKHAEEGTDRYKQFKKEIDEIILRLMELKKLTSEEFVVDLKTNSPAIYNRLEQIGYTYPATPTKTPTPETKKPKADTSEATLGIGKGVAQIVKAMVGVRSLYMLVRKIASQNENLTNALTNVFSSIATLLKPLFDFLAALVNWISTQIDKWNEAIGLEVKVSKNTEKITRTLASFDELDILNKKDDTTDTEAKYTFADFAKDYNGFLKTVEDKVKEAMPEETQVTVDNPTIIQPDQAGTGGQMGLYNAEIEWITQAMADIEVFFTEKVPRFFSETLPNGFRKFIDGIKEIIAGIWNWIVGFFTERIPNWFEEIKENFRIQAEKAKEIDKQVVEKLKQDWQSVKNFFTGIWTSMTDGLKKAVETIKSTFKSAINWVLDKVETAINNVIKKLNTGGLLSGINKLFKTSFSFKEIKIPRLANGGVIKAPTIAQLGEYAGANNNPEIAAPESKINELLSANNGVLLEGFAQMTKQIISAISDVDMTVSIGDDVIAKSASRGNNNYKRMTGYSLI